MSTAAPPQAQAFELGMHAALKAAGVKTAAEAEAFFKLANEHMEYQALEKRRHDAFEIGARGYLSDKGIKTAAAQDEIVKKALDIQELFGKAKETGGQAVGAAKDLGGKAIGKAKDIGGAVAGKAKQVGGAVAAKTKGPAGNLRDLIKRKLKSLGF